MLLLLVASAAVLTGLVLAILIWRARKPARLPALPLAMLGKPALMLLALRGLMAPLRYLATRREAHYKSAWMLVIGEQAAGKSSLLASLDPGSWQMSSEEQEKLVPEGSNWRFLPQGVLIDPPGEWSAAAPGSEGAQKWRQFLDKLDSLRPERPIDGVVLVVSARSLLADGSKERSALAESLRAQLALLESQYEFALPVYVVVSEMDSVKGFSEFWQTQSTVQMHEMVGWSMPQLLPGAAPCEWVDTAFDCLASQLKRLQVQTAAESSHPDPAQADQFFLFPRHFLQLREPLRQCMAHLMQPSAWQTGVFCRGLYFTGALPPAFSALAGASPAAGLPRSDIAFIDDLVAKKIFAEPYLARPTRKGIWSRNKLIRRAQFTAVALAALLLASLVWSAVQLREQAAVAGSAVAALQKIEQQLNANPPAQGRCIDRQTVVQTLEQIARLPADTVHWTIPATWLGRTSSGSSTQQVVNGVFQKVVLGGIACQLEQQAQALMAPPAAKTPDSGTLVHVRSQQALLEATRSIVRFQNNLARFQEIAATPPALKKKDLMPSFVALFNEVYQSPLPPSVSKGNGALRTALRQAQYPQALKLPDEMKPRLASQLSWSAQRLAAQLKQEVGAGSSLLAQMDQEDGSTVAKTRHFSSWLQWVGSAWSGSTASSNPCSSTESQLQEQASLLRAYGYPDAELKKMTGHFSKASCYQPNMATLASMQMAPYGSLFTRGDKGLMLNTQLLDELSGLKALGALDFMQLQDTQPFSCQRKVAGWRASDIGLANRYEGEYEQLMSSMKPAAGASQQPLYQRMALRQLERAMNSSLNRAQIPPGATVVVVDAAASEDQALARESSNFAALLEPLLTLQRSYRSLDFAASATQVYQCIGTYSSDSLARVQNLGDISRLYDSTSSEGPGPMFNLGTTPVIKDFLARQLARTQVLAGYSTPFLSYLNNSSGQNDAQNSNTQSAAYWSNTVTELNRYIQFKEPAGQVAQLDNLFLKQMPGLDAGNCSSAMADYKPAEYGNDLFSARRLKLESQIQATCKGERNAQAVKAYSTLSARFNRELAGRYPFGPLSSSDADLATARNFFADYSAQSAALRQSLQGLSGAYWTSARQFLSQLDASTRFFQGTLNLNPAPADGSADSSGLASLPVRLAVQFHAQPKDSAGADQLVGWSLSAGSKSAAFPNRSTALDWDYGQALVLDLTWASGSLWLPAPDLQQSDLQTNGVGASFAASGNWALLRLIERHRPGNGSIPNSSDPNRLTLEFLVPVTSKNSASGKAATGSARLYIGLNLSGSDPKTHAPVSLKLPQGFPRSAP